MGKVCAIILAGGMGKRMGSSVNKQYLKLKGEPILKHTIECFEKNKNIDKIVVVAAINEVEYCNEKIIKKYDFKKVSIVLAGGIERQNSVFNGLKAAYNCEIVLIHDGARPFVSNSIIDEGIKYARNYGACAPGVTPKDTIKVKNSEGFSIDTLRRETLISVQTPQCFKYDLILEAHKYIEANKIIVTDDTMAVEILNYKVFLYQGDYKNIKITTPEDLIIGEKILEA